MGNGTTTVRKSLPESVLDTLERIVLATDTELTIIYCNTAAIKAFGIDKEQLLQSSAIQLFDLQGAFWQELRDKFSTTLQNHIHRTCRLRCGTDPFFYKEIALEVMPMLGDKNHLIGWCLLATMLATPLQFTESKGDLDLDIVFDNISDGLIVDNADGKVMFANAQFLNMFGYEATDLFVLSPDMYVAPEYREEIWQRHRERMLGFDVPDEFEFGGVTKQGAKRWIHAKVSPIWENGQIVGTQTAIRDITDQKTAGENLLRAEQEMRDYKYALDQSTIVAITDQKGIIQYVNDVFCKISGYSREELMGQDHRIVNSGYHSKEFIRNLWVTIANGGIWKGEIQNKAKDGSLYWVDTTIVPFMNDRGKPHHYIAIRYDITERKNTEERLVKSEKTHRTVVENLPGAIITIINKEQKYEMAEGEGIRMMGHSPEKDYINQHILADVKPTVVAKIERMRSEAFSGKNISGDVFVNDRYFRVRYIPLYDENNEVQKVMTISLDITDIKKAELDIKDLNDSLERKVADRTRELEHVNKELEAFSYSVSHDLRAPLRIINGFADILVHDYGEKLDEEGKRLLGKITSSAQRMGKLIDELINLAHFGRKEMTKQITDFNKMIEHILEDLSLLNKKEIHVLKPVLPLVICDTNLMRQVWGNLLSNAVKYSGKRMDPVIEVGFIEREYGTEFFVKDNGVGFDMEFKDKLFGVFQRLHKRNEFEGTGIGLALVKRIVTRHEGEVWAEAQIDNGATFYFSLPKTEIHEK